MIIFKGVFSYDAFGKFKKVGKMDFTIIVAYEGLFGSPICMNTTD